MSIREQVEDARFLAQNGRHIGALTTLMLAVAASARRCFPKGTKSREKPAEKMGDCEAFTLFLGGRIRKILFGDFGGAEFGNSGISVGFKGQQHDVAYVLYKFYRCELVHEGDLPEDVEFVPHGTARIGESNAKQLSVSIGSGNRMVLDYGWIDVLIAAVVYARCNGQEFGIEHFDLVPKPGVNAADFERAAMAKYEITPGRFHILKHAVQLINPSNIRDSDDMQLSSSFLALVQSGQINAGAITGLSTRGLTNRAGQLELKGMTLLREIASAHELVRAS